VVIVGAGFGGLGAAHRLEGALISLPLVDWRNHHLFQPLLYQVATASLATSDCLAEPLSVAWAPDGTPLFATISGVDTQEKRVLPEDGDAVPSDTLVLATRARHAYFGHDEWE
jgi:NADH dehydrogenase